MLLNELGVWREVWPIKFWAQFGPLTGPTPTFQPAESHTTQAIPHGSAALRPRGKFSVHSERGYFSNHSGDFPARPNQHDTSLWPPQAEMIQRA